MYERSERVSHSVQFSSVAQSCPTLCDPMNRSTPGLPVHHQRPEFTQVYLEFVHWVSDAIQPSRSVVPFSSCPQPLPASESFPVSQLFAWGGQRIGVSALASVLPTNTQDWSPSEWTGWISLQSKGLSRVFSNSFLIILQFKYQVLREKFSPNHLNWRNSSFSLFSHIPLYFLSSTWGKWWYIVSFIPVCLWCIFSVRI